MRSNEEPLLTTDYVVSELLTLLMRRGQRTRWQRVRELFAGENCVRLEFVTPDDFFHAWDIMERYIDKEWSFVDCVSYVIMNRLDIKAAVALDSDFEQFANVTVFP